MTQCPKCNSQVNDGSHFCPNCGSPVMENPEDVSAKSIATESCVEMEPEENSDIIVVQPSTQIPNTNAKTKRNILIVTLCAILLIVGIFSAVSLRNSAKEKARIAEAKKEWQEKMAYNYYISWLKALNDELVNGAAECESILNTVHSTWYNAIYDKYNADTRKYVRGALDFNAAIANVYADTDIQKKLTKISESSTKSKNLLDDLKAYPKDLEKNFDNIINTSVKYQQLVSLAESPSGNLQSFVSTKKELISDFMETYSLSNTTIPSMKEINIDTGDAIFNNITKYIGKGQDSLPDELLNDLSKMVGFYKIDSYKIQGIKGEVSLFSLGAEIVNNIMWTSAKELDKAETEKLMAELDSAYGKRSNDKNIDDLYRWDYGFYTITLSTGAENKTNVNWISNYDKGEKSAKMTLEEE